MTASSFWEKDIRYAAKYGRLFNEAGFGWCSRNNSESVWLQADLGKEFYVGTVVTQGGSSYTTEFKLRYSSDEGTWQTYQNRNGKEVVIVVSI